MSLKPGPKLFRFDGLSIIDGKTPVAYLLRPLTVGEISTVFETGVTARKKLGVVIKSVVEPKEFNFLDPKALWGPIEQIFEAAVKVSRLDISTEELQGEVNDYLKSSLGAAEMAAVITLPGVTLETLRTSTLHDYQSYLVTGSILFNTLYKMEPSKLFAHLPSSKTTKSDLEDKLPDILPKGTLHK
jgi:hypothetical protein